MYWRRKVEAVNVVATSADQTSLRAAIRMSSPKLPYSVSSPEPPSKMSLPSLPFKTSLLAPPSRVSFPPRPKACHCR